jgi:hypothetical protein
LVVTEPARVGAVADLAGGARGKRVSSDFGCFAGSGFLHTVRVFAETELAPFAPL